jgi:hypothetical protein
MRANAEPFYYNREDQNFIGTEVELAYKVGEKLKWGIEL